MKIFGFLTIIVLLSACGQDFVPKQRAYFRIDLPAKKYSVTDTSNCPYTFELPQYAKMLGANRMPPGEQCWANIYFPKYKAEILLTYKSISKEVSLQALLEDVHKSTYSHQIKAERIDPITYEDASKRKYGLIFHVQGEVASQVQFCITDSTRHFLRGSLYFMSPPNKDSLAPVVEYLSKDIDQIVKTLEWK